MPSRLYPAAAGVAALLVLVPLPALRRTSNVAVLVGTACVFLSCFIYFVNTIAWAGNVRDLSPVWCDISTSPRRLLSPDALLSDGTSSSDQLLDVQPTLDGVRSALHL